MITLSCVSYIHGSRHDLSRCGADPLNGSSGFVVSGSLYFDEDDEAFYFTTSSVRFRFRCCSAVDNMIYYTSKEETPFDREEAIQDILE